MMFAFTKDGVLDNHLVLVPPTESEQQVKEYLLPLSENKLAVSYQSPDDVNNIDSKSGTL